VVRPESAPVAAARASSGAERRTAGRALLFLGMVCVAVVMLYPFYFMIDTSLRTQQQFTSGQGHSLASWRALGSVLPVGQQLWNSTVVCGLSIGVILVVSSLAGFAFAKLPFAGSTPAFLAIVSAMLIPMQSIIIPAYVNISRTGLLNTYYGAVLVYSALGTPFATFLLTAYYRGLPDDIVEAALVDGLGYGRVFLRIGLPLSVPALVTWSGCCSCRTRTSAPSPWAWGRCPPDESPTSRC
jgi:ABC-type glycerol-3-phosphate transport system permease component